MSNIVDGEIRNTEPASGRPLPPVRVTPTEDVRDVVVRARRAQGRWATLDWSDRRKRLLAFRDALNDRAEEMAESISRESGKVHFESLVWEVVNILDSVHFFGTRAEKFLQDQRVPHHFLGVLKRGYVRFEPRGVVGIIAPWNFPFMLAMSDVVMALAARNAVVVKPSEWAPHSILLARDIMAASGIDPDLFGVVTGAGDVGQALIEGGVDMIVFTGSVATGRKVAAACGERLIPYVAELGGKDAAIVLADVDIPKVADQVVHGAFSACGQACASFERVLVHASIHDEFVRAVVERTGRLRQGDPFSSSDDPVDLGAMTVPSQVAVVERHLADAKAKGAHIAIGGTRRNDLGERFFEPTVIVNVTDSMLCWTRETFGPTMPVRSFETVDEAVEMANALDYGLNASVFSSSVGRAEDVANRLQAGATVINDFFFNQGVPEAPWGGWKQSGVGRVRYGREGLRHLCETRFVSVPRSVPFELPLRFPYTAGKLRFWTAVRRFLKSPLSRWL